MAENDSAIIRFRNSFDLTNPRPVFYFIGSGVSAMGDTGLPDWTTYVNGLMTGLGRCAGLRREELRLVENLENHRQSIKDEISRVRKIARDNARAIRPSYLENYHMTDILSRRLGNGYLDVLEVIQHARSNVHHERLIESLLETNGAAKGIVTTNFDACIEDHLRRLSDEGRVQMRMMTGELNHDLAELESTRVEANSVPIVLLCQSFQSFDLVASLMYHIADGNSQFRFIFNIHGTANNPLSCIDSNFQREQRLPYGVSQALYSLYIKCNFLVAGYSGLDMKENLDYLRILSNWEHIEGIWLVQDLDRINDEDNFPPSRLRRKLVKFRKFYQPERGTIEFRVEDLRLPNAGNQDNTREEAFIDSLDMSMIRACSNEPIWAALALQDIVRALSNEVDRDILDNPENVPRSSDSQAVHDRYRSIPQVRTELETLDRGLSTRLQDAIRRVFAAQTPRAVLVQREWTDGWLIRNFANPTDIPDLQQMVGSLLELFRSIRRDREPSEEQRTHLNRLAQLIENKPERFADAWVVWATYIMLNYHDTERRRLCWAYYLKAVRSALHTGNVWGKLALDYFGEGIWKRMVNDYQRSDDRTALRLHYRPPGLTREVIHDRMRNLRDLFGPLQLTVTSKKNLRTVMDVVHVLGIDPDLPVHYHAQMPLPEYYRILLIISLLYSKNALMRESAGRGNHTFLKNTLHEAERKLDLFPSDTDKGESATFNQERSVGFMPEDGTQKTGAAHAIYSRLWLVKERDNTQMERLIKESSGCSALLCSQKWPHTSNCSIEHRPLNHNEQNDCLLGAMKRLVDREGEDSGIANTLIANFLRAAHQTVQAPSTIGLQYEILIEEVMTQLSRLVKNFERNRGGIVWSRDLLYDIFYLNGKKVINLNSEQLNGLVDESIRTWIDNVYRRRPWRYQDILQLLINSTFALHRPVLRAANGSKAEALLIANMYEAQLLSLGILAHTKPLERPNMQLKVHLLSGDWSDYSRFALADVARLRHDDSNISRYLTGEAKVMQYLIKSQIYGNQFDTQFDVTSSHARSRPIPTAIRPASLTDRQNTVKRLAEEFVVSSNRPLPSVYSAPSFNACLIKLVIVKAVPEV